MNHVIQTANSLSAQALWAAAAASLLPFLAFGLVMLFLLKRPKWAAGISITAISGSLAAALYLMAAHRGMTAPAEWTVSWAVSGEVAVPFGFLIDPLSLLMLVIVTAICFLVQVYSLGYMAGDPGFGRYYGCMSLFAWAMITLSISATLLQLYIFWELVGLASYLLIGFWFEKFSASTAGKKAFVMTRLGDVAFFMGIILLLLNLGNVNILHINGPEVRALMPPPLITMAALLIFGGVIGKSAQFPLLTWLPDAMEGPTPVSALLHSATMVAAGVFLFARIHPFFSLSPTAMTVCLMVGTVSMLLSSTMAMVSRDIKQVWAYSTISQLGFMIMGLGAGGWFAGVFHLTTHAGFKALLFLCSGIFIHAYHTNDMFAIGRAGGKRLRVPMLCMTIAAAALAGLPPFSGFFSKEAVMGVLAEMNNPVWLIAGLFGAFLTAYYTFRLIFIILFPRGGETGADAERRDHEGGRTGYLVMAGPLLVLAAVTIFLGPLGLRLERFLGYGEIHIAAHHGWLLYAALGAALSGLAAAWIEFGRRGAAQIGFVERIPGLYDLFAERWYIDRFYRWFLDTVIYAGLSGTFTENDRRVIDGGVDGIGKGAVFSGLVLANLHLGMIQYKLMVMFAVVFLLAIYFFF